MPTRVLALDGGGSWAMIEVMALMDLYGADARGHEVLGNFDVAVANSGGTLVLGGLIENRALHEIAAMIRDRRRRESIFDALNMLEKLDKTILGLGPRYSAARKLEGLRAAFDRRGQMALPAATADIPGAHGNPIHAVFVAYDYDRNRAKLFRSAAVGTVNQGGAGEDDVQLVHAIHASTNAPVLYFDEPARFGPPLPRYWDGGVTGMNNPALAGLTEAVGLRAEPRDVHVLSIGTGTMILPPRQPGEPDSPFVREDPKPGLIGDVIKLAKSVLGDPPDSAGFIAHVLSGGSTGLPDGVFSRVIRLNPLIRPVRTNGSWQAPDGLTTQEFQLLRDMDMDAVADEEVALIEKFARLWLNGAPINQPLRYDTATLAPTLGRSHYAQAKADWQTLAAIP